MLQKKPLRGLPASDMSSRPAPPALVLNTGEEENGGAAGGQQPKKAPRKRAAPAELQDESGLGPRPCAPPVSLCAALLLQL